MYTGLILFKDIKGHMDVPAGTMYNGEYLRDWVDSQKMMFMRAKDAAVAAAAAGDASRNRGLGYPECLRFAKLEAIGFDSLLPKRHRKASPSSSSSIGEVSGDGNTATGGNSPHTAAWEEMFHGAALFLRKNGHLTVPSNVHHNGRNLSLWVEHQRELLQKCASAAAARKRGHDPHGHHRPSRSEPLTPAQVSKLRSIGLHMPSEEEEEEEEV